MTSIVGDDFKSFESSANESCGSLNGPQVKDEETKIRESIKDIMSTRLQYVKASKREGIEKKVAEIDASTQSLASLQSKYKEFVLRFIGVTETWEKRTELFPLAIEVLLEESEKEGLLTTNEQNNMNALIYAACIGDVKAIERAEKIRGKKLPKELNRGKTLPLGMAVHMGQYEFAKALVAAGADLNARDDSYDCILHNLIQSKKPENVEFYLQQEGVDVNAKDEFDHTTLHRAVLMKDAAMVALLLKNKAITAQKEERDLFGRTPLDIALQEKSDDVIRLLIDNPTIDVQTLPGYGIAPVVINQGHILGKLTQYLTLKQKQKETQLEQDKIHLSAEEIDARQKAILDPEKTLTPGGQCNGLSFVMQYYSFKEKEDEFYAVMELFSKWDGTEESLKSTESLKELSGGYKDLEDLMEQWTNDIIWFQQNYDAYYQQQERLPQLEMVRKSSDDKVTPATPITYTLTQEQLAEWLQIRSYFPGTVIEFTGSGHNTTLKILPQGKAAYYDSNFHFRIPPFTSMDRLASVIHRTKHLAMRKSRKKIREGMIIYRMYSGEKKAEPVQTTPAVFLDQASPNGYSKLHFAILFNDIDLFNTELAKEGATVNQANAHGHTLLHDAIIFGREEMVQKLMSFPEIDISVQTNQKSLLNLSIQYRQENIAKMLLNRGVEIWGSGFYEAVETNQREVVKAMIARGMTPHEINYAVLPRLERPLHLAIYRRDKEMITLLLKNGANPKAQAMEKVGSPLACLADIRDAEFLKFMISILPDLDGADEDKMTLLQHATLKGNAELVALLSQTSN